MPLPHGFTAIKDARADNASVNLLGIVVSIQAPKKTKGPDWCLEFCIQDEFVGSVGDASSINCRLFGTQDKLPKISGPGDVVILRRFKLSAWNMRVDCFGNIKSRSGVLVFPVSRIPVPELSQAYQLGNQKLHHEAMWGTDELTIQEQMAVIHLKHAASGMTKQVQQHAAITSSKAVAHDRFSLIKDLEFDKFYDVRALVVNTYYHGFGDTVDLKVTDFTPNDCLFYYADPQSADSWMVNANDHWVGPYGYLTLGITLYDSNAAWAREHVSPGDFVFLRNMRTKMSQANKLEGVLHQDRLRPTQVDIRILSNISDITEIKRRREVYEKQNGSKSALDVLRDVPKESAKTISSKKAAKKLRQQESKVAKLNDWEKKVEKRTAERSGVNIHIRAAFPERKLSTISEIIYNPSLKTRTTKYNDFNLPFVNSKHRARVRVVDVFPPEVGLFSHSLSDRLWKPRRGDKSNSRTKDRWEWGFILLLEDADIPPNTVSEKLRVIVANDVGQGLLDQNASDLRKDKRKCHQLEERLFILWGNLMELKTEMRDRGSDLPLPPGDNRLQNKPFDCCIEEYGHEVPITDQNPLGHQRMFRLAQTFITT